MLNEFLQTFDAGAEQYKPNDFPALPNGNYLVIATAGEERESKINGTKYLAMTYEVLEGEYKGRKLFVNFHLFNPSVKAKEIAVNNFRGLCYAVNVREPRDISMVLNKPFYIKVSNRKNAQTNELENEVKQYIPATGNINNAQPVSSGKPPWKN